MISLCFLHTMKSSVALVLALAIPLSSGCKLLKKRGAEGDGTSSGEETSGEAPSKAKPKSGCALPEGGRVTSALTLTKGCTLKVTENIAIDEGGTLTIEAGAKLEMATHTYISVDSDQAAAMPSTPNTNSPTTVPALTARPRPARMIPL